jgi:hypothetical protein
VSRCPGQVVSHNPQQDLKECEALERGNRAARNALVKLEKKQQLADSEVNQQQSSIPETRNPKSETRNPISEF